MTLESVFVPIPSEVTMPFAGYLASRGELNLWAAILVGAFGNLIGSLAGYYIGYFLEEHVLVRWIRAYGKYVLMRESDYHKGASWFAKYGSAAVFVSRLLPAVRTFISLPAGMFEMDIWKFSLYTFGGSLIWSGLLTWVGYMLGNQWSGAGDSIRVLEYFIIICAVLLIGYYIYRRIREK
jgi:membrane protein DedA with SNARE-associated domain